MYIDKLSENFSNVLPFGYVYEKTEESYSEVLGKSIIILFINRKADLEFRCVIWEQNQNIDLYLVKNQKRMDLYEFCKKNKVQLEFCNKNGSSTFQEFLDVFFIHFSVVMNGDLIDFFNGSKWEETPFNWRD